MTFTFFVFVVVVVLVVWIAWRKLSRKRQLPCPAWLGWLIELENPLARVSRSSNIIRLLEPEPGECIADIGCGPGRVTLPLAQAVGPDGEIIALDLQADMLTRIAAKAERHGLSNIRLLLGDVGEPHLPEGMLDGAVMVMALGEIPDAQQVFPILYAALADGGRLLVAESVFDPHYVRQEQVSNMATAAGFTAYRGDSDRFAYCTVFMKPARLAHSHTARAHRFQSRTGSTDATFTL